MKKKRAKKFTHKLLSKTEPILILRAPAVWISLACLLWLIIGCWFYIQRTGPPAFKAFFSSIMNLHFNPLFLIQQYSWVCLKALALWTGIVLVGRTVLTALKLERKNSWETIALSSGIGIAFFAYVFFLLGAVGLLRPLWINIFIGGLTFIGVIKNRDVISLKKWKIFCSGHLTGKGAVGMACVIVVGIGTVISFLYALGPEVFFDSLVYHLALPKLYLLEHKLVPTPYNVYSGIPETLEYLYGIGLYLGGEEVAKLMSWGIGVLCLIALLALSEKKGFQTGWLAGAIFLSTPLVAHKWGITGTEPGIALFVLLSVLAGRHLFESSGTSQSVSWSLICGVMIGLAMGSKYTAWILLPAFILCFGWIQFKSDSFLRQKCLLISLSASLVLLPWVLKNHIFYSNPVFPFLHDTITDTPLEEVNWKRLQEDAWGRNLKKSFSSFSGIRSWLLSFWRKSLTDSQNIDASYAGPLYALFLPLLGFYIWRKKEDWLSIGVFTGFFAFWMVTTSMLRLMTPGLGILAFLIARLVLESESPGWLKKFQQGLILFFCLNNIASWGFTYYSSGTSRVVMGDISKEEFLSYPRPTYPYPSYLAFQFINQHTLSLIHI